MHNFVLLRFINNKTFSNLYQSDPIKQSFVGTANMHHKMGRDIYWEHSYANTI